MMAVLVVVIGAVAVIGTLALRYTAIVPGAAYDAGSLSASAGEGSGLVVMTVGVRRASALDLVRAWLNDERLERFEASPSSHQEARDAFVAARNDAWTAAHRCLGLRPDAAKAAQAPSRVPTGASGGLMMALADVASLRGRPFSTAAAAGTGAIASDGSVHDVEAVGLKARSAEAAGATLFFVPQPQIGEAQHAAPRLEVVGVRTLHDALLHLGDPGCSATTDTRLAVAGG